ncbi:hypothetical protein CKA32_000796 [Geitlerinema sp. FC II]|nr:hypothetical protein CKA32_000796 [Geitlerinema sp. FC II]
MKLRSPYFIKLFCFLDYKHTCYIYIAVLNKSSKIKISKKIDFLFFLS